MSGVVNVFLLLCFLRPQGLHMSPPLSPHIWKDTSSSVGNMLNTCGWIILSDVFMCTLQTNVAPTHILCCAHMQRQTCIARQTCNTCKDRYAWQGRHVTHAKTSMQRQTCEDKHGKTSMQRQYYIKCAKTFPAYACWRRPRLRCWVLQHDFASPWCISVQVHLIASLDYYPRREIDCKSPKNNRHSSSYVWTLVAYTKIAHPTKQQCNTPATMTIVNEPNRQHVFICGIVLTKMYHGCGWERFGPMVFLALFLHAMAYTRT